MSVFNDVYALGLVSVTGNLDVAGTINANNGTTGVVTVGTTGVDIKDNGALQLRETSNGNVVTMKAAAVASADINWVFPATAPVAGESLRSTGTPGVMEWFTSFSGDVDLVLTETGGGTDTITLSAPAAVTASHTLFLPGTTPPEKSVLHRAAGAAAGELTWSTGPTLSGDLTVEGSLTVSGTTTLVDTTNMEIKDKVIDLNKDGNDTGISGIRIVSNDINSPEAILSFDHTADKWRVGEIDDTPAYDIVTLTGTTGLDTGDIPKITAGNRLEKGLDSLVVNELDNMPATATFSAAQWDYLSDLSDPTVASGGVKREIQTKAAGYTVTTTALDLSSIYLVPNTADVTMSLPAIASTVEGYTMTIMKTTNNAFTVTIDPNLAETIEGNAALVLSVDKQRVSISAFGGSWYIV